MKVIKVVRQITYYGDADEVNRILRKSLPTHKFLSFVKNVILSVVEVEREDIPPDKVSKQFLEERKDGETPPI